MTVRNRIIGAFLTLVLVLVGAVAVVAPRRLSQEYVNQIRSAGYATTELLAGQLTAAVEFEDEDALKEAMLSASNIRDAAYTEVLDKDGSKILASAGERPAAVDALPNTGTAETSTDHFVVIQRDIFSSENDERLGVVRMAMSLGRLESQKQELYGVITLAAAIVSAVGLFFAFLLDRMIARPVRLVTRGVREVAAGRLEGQDIAIQSKDEFGVLAGAFNRMRRDLLNANEKLEEAAEDAEQRAVMLARANRDLGNLNEQLEEFAYAASHDLRAPLRAILTLVEFIEEDLAELDVPDETKQHFALISQRVQRMENLLTSLLEYSRVGRKGVDPEAVDTSELLTEIVDMLSPPAEFTIDIADDMPSVETGRGPLERVFLNLISNAIKHHDKPNGRIALSAHIDGDFVVFSVEDDGPGIPEKLQKKAFKMFEQLRRSDAERGTGMGLAMIRKIVETAGGEIEVESRGRGCTFRFTWPVTWQWRQEAAE